jgi:hypothetical protein
MYAETYKTLYANQVIATARCSSIFESGDTLEVPNNKCRDIAFSASQVSTWRPDRHGKGSIHFFGTVHYETIKNV